MRRGLPLVGLLVLAAFGIVLASNATLATLATRTHGDSVKELWRQLAGQILDRTTEHVLSHLRPAVSFAVQNQRMVDMGQLDVADTERLWASLEVSIDAYSTLSSAGLGLEDGRYVGVYRWRREDGTWEIRRTYRSPIGSDGGPPATNHHEQVRRDGAWITVRNEPGRAYDPRTYDWYRVTRACSAGSWTGPSIFHTRGQVGVHYNLPARDARGELLGIWSAAFESQPLVRFLQSVSSIPGAMVYLLDAQGHVVARPTGSLVDRIEGEPALLSATRAADPVLLGAWGALEGGAAAYGESFAFQDHRAMGRRFPPDLGVPWVVIVAVPEEAIFGDVRRHRRDAVVVFLVLMAIIVALSWLFTMLFSRRLGALRSELSNIARFEITDVRLADSPSMIREFNDIATAADRMKLGLASFGCYTPRAVVRQVLDSGGKAELGVQSMEVSVLFTDIEDFTTLVEQSPPEAIVGSLRDYLQLLDAEITHTEGLRLSYLGDGAMAMWGAPAAQPDHAILACRAALAMDAVSERLAAVAQESDAPVFRSRLGLNTGLTLVGNIGTPDRFSFTCVGDVVNIAARLEPLNKIYKTHIIVGQRTVDLASGVMSFRKLDAVRATGRDEPIPVFQLLGEAQGVAQATRDGSAHYEAGLVLYQRRDFQGAIVEFTAAFDAFAGADFPSSLMLSRCREFLRVPPDGGWDGAYRMITR